MWKGWFCLALLLPVSGFGQVYKYEDDHGNWHFTDRPPSGDAAIKGLEVVSGIRVSTDISKTLQEKFKPKSVVQAASLSVVSVKTGLVEGSGFFITDDGYLLTNKHVVKPTEFKLWEDIKETVKQREEAFNEAKSRLDDASEYLDDREAQLESLRADIDRSELFNQKKYLERRYGVLEKHYKEEEDEYFEASNFYKKKKREFDIARRELSIRHSSSVLQKNYKIVLKNDHEVTARLVAVSEDKDLALLQIKGYKTPFIEAAAKSDILQGMQVFAIGSPLGLKDIVSSGIVSGLEKEYVIADTKILPGSSGGPLITQSGKVIGINTQRISQTVGGEGFGFALYMEDALDEFSQYLK